MTEAMKTVAKMSTVAKWVQTLPDIGVQTAMAIEAFAPDMTCSQGGRDFWPGSGLVPKQQSTGGKSRLGKVSEMGQVDTRSQRIPGAMSGITAATRFGMKKGGGGWNVCLGANPNLWPRSHVPTEWRGRPGR